MATDDVIRGSRRGITASGSRARGVDQEGHAEVARRNALASPLAILMCAERGEPLRAGPRGSRRRGRRESTGLLVHAGQFPGACRQRLYGSCEIARA